MDFEETDEQSMIRGMVRAFAEETLAPTCLDRDKEQRAPLEEWMKFCESTGLQGVTIPDEYGGSEVDSVSESIIVEELARVDPSFSVMYCVHVGLCSMTIALHGSEEQKKKYIEPIITGEHVWCQGFSEPGAGSDLASRARTGVRDGDHFGLNGLKTWCCRGAWERRSCGGARRSWTHG